MTAPAPPAAAAPALSPDALAARRRNRRLLAWLSAGLVPAAALAGAFAARRPAVYPPLDAASPDPGGALGLFEAARRLGWAPRREELPLREAPRPGATYAALRAPHGVREADAGRLLAAVRAGASLVVDVRPDGDPLTDSLGLALDGGRAWALDNGAAADSLGAAAAIARPGCDPSVRDASDGTEHVGFVLADSGRARAGTPGLRTFVAVRDATPDSVPFRARPRAGERPAVRDPAPVLVGFPLGRGRVVAVADAALFTNAALKTCWAAAGPAVVRALEWATPPGAAPAAGAAPVAGRGPLVFLQGRRAGPAADGAPAPSVLGATWRALTEVPAGRAAAQAFGAALVLLAALGARALPPLPSARARRRSPREHVAALAAAYREAGATRLVAARLARGLRRRYGAAAARPAAVPTGTAAPTGTAGPAADPADADAAFLAAVAERHPAAAADAARLAAAARAPVPRAELPAVADAAARLDALLDAARRGA